MEEQPIIGYDDRIIITKKRREKASVKFMPGKPIMLNNWQPIETAPKDGTDILLYVTFVEQRHRMVGYYNNYVNCWERSAPVGYYPNKINPTHWMPLPESPKE